MGDSLENQDTSVETQNATIVDYGAFVNYIRKAATILLPEEDAVPPALNIALEDKANQDCIKKFLSDSQVQALFIQRSCTKGINLRKINKFLGFYCTYRSNMGGGQIRFFFFFILIRFFNGVICFMEIKMTSFFSYFFFYIQHTHTKAMFFVFI